MHIRHVAYPTHHVELLGNLPSLELLDVNIFLTYLMPAKLLSPDIATIRMVNGGWRYSNPPRGG